MEKMLEILDGAVQEISKLKAEVVKIIHDYNAQVEDLRNKSIDLDNQREDISLREEAVAKIENIISLEANAKALMKEAVELKTSVQKEKDSFVSFRNEENRQLNILRNELNEKGKYIKNEYAAMKKERELLEEEKVNYKQKIAAGLINLADKK